MAATLPGTLWLEQRSPLLRGYPFTFATWLRSPTGSAGTGLISWGAGTKAEDFHGLVINPSRGIRADSRAAGVKGQADTAATMSDARWYHAAASFISATERRAYLSGVRDTSSVEIPYVGSMLAVGANAQNGLDASTPTTDFTGRFVGDLAHAAVFNRALSDTEIAILAKGFTPEQVAPHALVAYWPFARNDNDGTTWRDRWSDGRDLAVAGTGSVDDGADAPPMIVRRGRRGFVHMQPAPTAAPSGLVLVAPASGSIDVYPVELVWTANGADTFDVYLGPTGSALSLVATTSARSYTPTGLAPGTAYTWRIVARNAAGTTTSGDATLTTLSAPEAPLLPTPPDGAIGVPAGSILSWSEGAHASAYNVYFGPAGGPLALVAAGTLARAYAPRDLASGASYAWRVEAVNAIGTALGPVWTFRTALGPVRPLAITLEAALGGGFRSNLINESYNIATYPLGDAIAPGARAQDISGSEFHGTWKGTGFAPGIAFMTIPEGVLGSTFDGNGWAEVPSETPPQSGWNLSLAQGDVDIAVLVRDVPIDGRNRCIVGKQDGDQFGNGWHLSIVNGQIEFFIRVAGNTVVNMHSATVLDAREHIITTSYLTEDREAIIEIDGVRDRTVTGLSGVELQYTTGPLRIGAFVDAAEADGSGFIGTMAYVSFGREGDRTLGARLQATRAWTALTEDVRTTPAPIATRTGIPGSSASDHVATTGTLTFPIDNSRRREGLGAYTPGHPNVRAGWELGIPIRLSVLFGVRYYVFHGRLAEVRPIPGLRGSQHADCSVTDWMDVAAGTPITTLPIQLNLRSDQVFAAVLSQAQGRAPMAIDAHLGQGTFPFAADIGESERETMLTELGRVALSEDGFIYIRGDQQGGGRLTFEAHGERLDKPVAATISNTMQGLDVGYTLERFYNIVRVFYTPRKVDPNIHALYVLGNSESPQKIEAGATRVISGGYVDPDNLAQRVGGTEMQPLTAGIDYGLRANENGTGDDLTIDLAVVQTLGGNSFRVELTNNSGQDAFLWVSSGIALQVRGRGIYHYQPASEERRDMVSVRERGPRVLTITLPYESDVTRAGAIADYYLALFNREQPVPSSLTINGNINATHMRYCLELEPGDKLALAEPLTGLTLASARFIIHEKRLSILAPGIVTASFGLAPSPRGAAALTPARLNVMRLGASRLNYLGTGAPIPPPTRRTRRPIIAERDRYARTGSRVV